VIVLNTALAFVQEQQAVRAVEAPDFVFSGATCTSGEAPVAVFASRDSTARRSDPIR
jgi:hypothetical protein